jgi:hypothetical protein
MSSQGAHHHRHRPGALRSAASPAPGWAVHPLFRGRSHPMDAVAAAVVDQRVIRAPSNRGGGGPIQV